MSTSGKAAPTRRERRAAERAAGRATVTAAGRPAWQSPIVLASVAALAVGLVIVVALGAGSLNRGSNEPLRTPAAAAPAPELRDGRSLGAAGAPVTIDIFEDPQCPVCGRWTRYLEPLLVASYIRDGTVRLTYHDFVFIGPESTDAAIGMRAADALAGKFWDYHAMVFANQNGENAGAFAKNRLGDMAALIGLDRTAFLGLLDNRDLSAAVGAETQQGASLGIKATPTMVINGQVIPGLPSWEQLSALIDELAAAGIASPGASPGG